MIPLTYYLILFATLFIVGALGVLIRRNALIIFKSVELMLNAANLAFVAFARQYNVFSGQLFVFFVMTVAAAEVAVGLALIVAIFNLRIGEALDMVNELTKPCDIWFLDGHGPKKNPSIWRHELLVAIGRKTATEETCATFTVAGAVRRGLVAAGFAVEQRPGFGGKKSVLKGIKL